MNDRSSPPICSCMHYSSLSLSSDFPIIVLPFDAFHRCLTALLFLRIGRTVVDMCIKHCLCPFAFNSHACCTFLHDAIYKIKIKMFLVDFFGLYWIQCAASHLLVHIKFIRTSRNLRIIGIKSK